MKYAAKLGYSDIEPFEVLERRSEKLIVIREMQAVLHPDWKPDVQVGGFAGFVRNCSEQEWIISPDPEGRVVKIRLHKDGNWRDVFGNKYALRNEPYKFYDYNF